MSSLQTAVSGAQSSQVGFTNVPRHLFIGGNTVSGDQFMLDGKKISFGVVGDGSVSASVQGLSDGGLSVPAQIDYSDSKLKLKAGSVTNVSLSDGKVHLHNDSTFDGRIVQSGFETYAEDPGSGVMVSKFGKRLDSGQIQELVTFTCDPADPNSASVSIPAHAEMASEEAARIAGDSALTSALSAAQAAITLALSNEATSRINGDDAQSAALTAEAASARAAEAANAAAITAEASTARAAEVVNADGLTAEIARAGAAEVAEAAARQAQDGVLQVAIDDEAGIARAAEAAEVAARTAALAAEAARALAAEAVNAGDIADEKTRAEAAEAAEAAARVAGDAGLQSQIDHIVSNVDPAALDSLTEVVTAFQLADSNMSNSITNLSASATSALAAEATTARAAEQANAAAIVAEASTARAAEAAEATARAAADSGLQAEITGMKDASDPLSLQGQLDAEEARAAAAEASEAASRLAGDTALQTAMDAAAVSMTQSIADEAARATAAEVANAGAISAETTRAGLAEAANASDIADEKTRAEAAEAAEAAARAAADAGLQSEVDYIQDASEPLSLQGQHNTEVARALAAESQEAADRAAGDAALQASLNAASAAMTQALTDEAARAGLAEAANAAGLAAEITRAGAAEAANAAGLAAEITRAGTAEAANATLIAANEAARVAALAVETAARTAADATHTAGIAAEITRASAAEAANATAISNILSNADPAALDSFTEIIAAYDAADGVLQAAIDTLGTTRAAALAAEVASLETKISAEETRASGAEGVNAAAIAAEAVTARAAEGVNAAAIAAEATAARAAEAVLQSNVDAEAATRLAADDAHDAKFDALAERVDYGTSPDHVLFHHHVGGATRPMMQMAAGEMKLQGKMVVCSSGVAGYNPYSPDVSSLDPGTVYVDDNGFLRVAGYPNLAGFTAPTL